MWVPSEEGGPLTATCVLVGAPRPDGPERLGVAMVGGGATCAYGDKLGFRLEVALAVAREVDMLARKCSCGAALRRARNHSWTVLSFSTEEVLERVVTDSPPRRARLFDPLHIGASRGLKKHMATIRVESNRH